MADRNEAQEFPSGKNYKYYGMRRKDEMWESESIVYPRSFR